jgi:hypothetical protein
MEGGTSGTNSALCDGEGNLCDCRTSHSGLTKTTAYVGRGKFEIRFGQYKLRERDGYDRRRRHLDFALGIEFISDGAMGAVGVRPACRLRASLTIARTLVSQPRLTSTQELAYILELFDIS